MQCVTAVDGEWLAELGPMFYSIKETRRTESLHLQSAQNAKDKLELMRREMRQAEIDIENDKKRKKEKKAMVDQRGMDRIKEIGAKQDYRALRSQECRHLTVGTW